MGAVVARIDRRALPGLTVEEVAARFGVATSTVWGWIYRGLLPAVRYGGIGRGGATRCSPAVVRAFVPPAIGRPPRATKPRRIV